MNVDVGAPLLLGFLLAMVRGIAWLIITPPFAHRGIPITVKVALSMALAAPVAPRLAESVPSLNLAEFVGALLMQVFAGLALGFVTMVIFSAVQAAGDLLDLFGGFSLASGFDPLSQHQGSVMGKFYYWISLILLFTVDGHLLLIRGFFTSYDALPLDALLNPEDVAKVVFVALGQFFLAALQIAAPLIAVLFLVDAALGLLTKVSPALNAFSLGFPAKILATLLMVAAALPLMPGIVRSLVDMALHAMSALMRG